MNAIDAYEPMSLPPLEPRTQSVYGFAFTPDGYPYQLQDGKIVANPIFAPYVIIDYLRQFDATGDPAFVDAIRHVARAALARMEEVGDGLAFLYGGTDGPQPVRNPGRHYSGLTQSYYLLLFRKIADISPDEERAFWAESARRVLKSLFIPASEGGVLYRRAAGPIIAETPREPEDVVLNGWLTAAVHLGQYAELAQDAEARELFRETTEALASYLPVFDVPELCNSRYSSSGYGLFRLVFPSTRGRYRVRSLRLHIPDEPAYPITEVDSKRWNLYSVAADWDGEVLARRTLRVNLVLNYLSFPKMNSLAFDVEVPEDGRVALEYRKAAYSPTSAAPTVDPAWVKVASAGLVRGWNRVELRIPWRQTHLLAYPTNFLKRDSGKYYNGYHWLHIDQLRRLHKLAQNEIFGDYADRWHAYVLQWPNMDVYTGVETTKRP